MTHCAPWNVGQMHSCRFFLKDKIIKQSIITIMYWCSESVQKFRIDNQ